MFCIRNHGKLDVGCVAVVVLSSQSAQCIFISFTAISNGVIKFTFWSAKSRIFLFSLTRKCQVIINKPRNKWIYFIVGLALKNVVNLFFTLLRTKVDSRQFPSSGIYLDTSGDWPFAAKTLTWNHVLFAFSTCHKIIVCRLITLLFN